MSCVCVVHTLWELRPPARLPGASRPGAGRPSHPTVTAAEPVSVQTEDPANTVPQSLCSVCSGAGGAGVQPPASR